jgi:hypothetical protein
MPTPTYDLIASNVLTTSASSVIFSSLPSTGYRDLVLVVNVISTLDSIGVRARVNGDTGSNYPMVYMTGNGTSTGSAGATQSYIYASANAFADETSRWLGIYNLLDYSATDKHKPILVRSNQTGGTFFGTEAVAVRWANTAAINSIEIYPSSGSWDATSSFHLYGIVS